MSNPIRNVTGILPGDLIRLTQDELIIEARIARVNERYMIQIGGHSIYVDNLFAAGFTAEILDRPAPRPVEGPYVWTSYVNHQDGTIHPGARIVKYHDGKWQDASGGPLTTPEVKRAWASGTLVPLTVARELRPEPNHIVFD